MNPLAPAAKKITPMINITMKSRSVQLSGGDKSAIFKLLERAALSSFFFANSLFYFFLLAKKTVPGLCNKFMSYYNLYFSVWAAPAGG